MLRLRFPERTGLSHFRHHLTRPKPAGFHVGDGVDCDPFLFAGRVEDRGAITGSSIVTLPVHRSRIVNLEEELQQLSIAQLPRIEDDLDGFGMACMITVRRIGDIAARIPDTCGNYAWVTAYQVLHAPKAAAGKNCGFSRHGYFLTPSDVVWNSLR